MNMIRKELGIKDRVYLVYDVNEFNEKVFKL